MTDWNSREGARLGEDLRRDQAEAVRDGELSVGDREDRRHDFREALREILERRSSILCGICGDEEIDLSPADDVDEALEIWDDHVRDVHDDHGGEPVPIADGGVDPLEEIERGTTLVAGTTGWRYDVLRTHKDEIVTSGPHGPIKISREDLVDGLDEGLITVIPEIVCLCGSTRFKEEFREANKRLTLEGKIVLSVGFFGHVDGWPDEASHEDKNGLDELHKRKIDLADRIFVVNPGGYVGDSTASEIEYAWNNGVPIEYLEEPPEDERIDRIDPEALVEELEEGSR